MAILATAGRVFAPRPLATAAMIALALGLSSQAARAELSDELLERLRAKGVLTEEEYQELKSGQDDVVKFQRDERRRQALKEAQRKEKEDQTREAEAKATKFSIGPGVKSLEVFGDVRLRYESRDASSSVASSLAGGPTDVARERWRYAVRVGIRGDLGDDWFYGLRLDTGSNNRSAWVTFGDGVTLADKELGPSQKSKASMSVGQAYLGWRTTPWLTLQAGKMPNPFYSSTMVWDPDIAPEALAERVSFKPTEALELFGNFAQIMYGDLNPDLNRNADLGFHKKDALLLGWQGGMTYRFSHDTSAKAALTYYQYEGAPTGNGTFRGDLPPATTAAWYTSQNGINNLRVLDAPFEVNFTVLKKTARIFGDFAVNLDGDARARAAGHPDKTSSNKAFLIGAAYGTLGTVYGQQAKKGTWEVRSYWQRIEQYALDPNLIDSDFFERTNMEGLYFAAAYCFTDGIIGTFRYGFANQIDRSVGTGGSNGDLPYFNPIRDYRLGQVDLTWKF